MKSAARGVAGIAAVVLAVAFGLALLVHVPAAYAVPVSFIATYTFTAAASDPPLPSAPVDSNPGGLTFSDITRGAGLVAVAGATSINSRAWTTSTVFDATANDFYTLTVTPSAGVTMNLDELDFTERRSGTGPVSFEIRSSLDAFTAAVATFSHLSTDTANMRQTFALPMAFDNQVSPVTFKIFGFGATTGTLGTWRLGVDPGSTGSGLAANLQVSGITEVPEPGTLLLLGSGLIGAGAIRRRYYRP